MRSSLRLFIGIAALSVGGLMIPASAAADANPKVDRAWKANCASCHGNDGKGGPDQGKKMDVGDMTLKAWQGERKEDDLKKAIVEGFKRTSKGGKSQEMKSFKEKLAPEIVDGLVVYVRAFAK